MDKRTFIQNCVIRKFPDPDSADRLIDAAEKIWAKLSDRGYGDKCYQEDRNAPKAYSRLNDESRALFDRFWSAWGKYGNKQGGAKAWMDLNPSKELAELLIEAAGMVAVERAGITDHTPIYPQGWLSQAQYERYIDAIERNRTLARKSNTHEQISELAHAKRMVELNADPSGAWQSIIDSYENSGR